MLENCQAGYSYENDEDGDADADLVHGDADEVVPVAENSDIIESRYRKLGGNIMVIRKKDVGHHPHSLKDPKPIVDFLLKHQPK